MVSGNRDLTTFVAAASTYINLAFKESDNNVKLIVLDRLDVLHSKHGHVLDGLIMDIVQILSRSVTSSLPLVVTKQKLIYCLKPRSRSPPEDFEHRPEHDVQ